VDQEHATALEPNNQILAAALHRSDALTDELGGDDLGIEGPHEPGIGDRRYIDPASFEDGRETTPHGLDLG
jgi:hypothetical protein